MNLILRIHAFARRLFRKWGPHPRDLRPLDLGSATCCLAGMPSPRLVEDARLQPLALEMRARLESGDLFRPFTRCTLEHGAEITAVWREAGRDEAYAVMIGPRMHLE